MFIKVKGDPDPELHWYRNGLPVRKNSRYNMSKDGETATLNIRNVGVNDEGTYTVKAVNKFGSVTSQCQLFVESKCEIILFCFSLFLQSI